MKPPKPGQAVSSLNIVAKCWGANAPQWVKNLALECDRSSQAKAAIKIGRSGALVNQVLQNKYSADLEAVKIRVEAVIGNGVVEVECPILGEISGAACVANQERPFQPYNHQMVTLFRACKTCPHRMKKGGCNAE